MKTPIYELKTKTGTAWIVLPKVCAVEPLGTKYLIVVSGIRMAYELPDGDDPQSRAKVIAMAVAAYYAPDVPRANYETLDPFADEINEQSERRALMGGY